MFGLLQHVVCYSFHISNALTHNIILNLSMLCKCHPSVSAKQILGNVF